MANFNRMARQNTKSTLKANMKIKAVLATILAICGTAIRANAQGENL